MRKVAYWCPNCHSSLCNALQRLPSLYDHPATSDWSIKDSCPCTHYKSMWWSEHTHQHILNFCTRWRPVVRLVLWPLTPPTERIHGTHLTGEWEGPRADENMLHRKKNVLPLLWSEFLHCTIHSLAVPTMLSWLHMTEIANLHTLQSIQAFILCKVKKSTPFNGLDSWGIESWWGWDLLNPSRMVVGPTQPPIQWVPGLPGVKQLRCGIDHPPPFAPRLRKE
jgi:hypothetical protein